jgi:hypothetical protein
MALKQKTAMRYMSLGFKVWVLCILAGVMVSIVLMPLMMGLGLAIGVMAAVVAVIITLPLVFLATGWVFTKFYNK